MNSVRAGLVLVAAICNLLEGHSAQAAEARNASADLERRLRQISDRARGTVGFAVQHVETGRTILLNGTQPLPLYSVFKLPLAITVLKDVESGRLRLDQAVRVTPADVVPGGQGNTDRWRKPAGLTVHDLLELSLVESDNTSSDKLLQLVGGPGAVTRRMRALGFPDIHVRASVREFAGRRRHPNIASAKALVGLLSSLQKGRVLDPGRRRVLLDLMARTTTGDHRIKGLLPPGTPVAAKTGTGPAATNDVGLVTLPNHDHVAIAALVSGSKLPAADQEKIIAELARAAYDALNPSLPAR